MITVLIIIINFLLYLRLVATVGFFSASTSSSPSPTGRSYKVGAHKIQWTCTSLREALMVNRDKRVAGKANVRNDGQTRIQESRRLRRSIDKRRVVSTFSFLFFATRLTTVRSDGRRSLSGVWFCESLGGRRWGVWWWRRIPLLDELDPHHGWTVVIEWSRRSREDIWFWRKRE